VIVKRRWESIEKISTYVYGFYISNPKYHYTGWFLFGFIPLYIVREG